MTNKENKRLFNDVAEQISALLDEGVFPPGTRLPGERELAERFGVSRVTVREAAVALQALGRIVIKPGSGIYVCERRGSRDALPEMSPFELTEARALFESEAAALAAPLIDTATLQRLRGFVDAMASHDPHDAAAANADREFHMTIAAATRNRTVQYVIEMLWRIRTEMPDVRRSYDDVCERDSHSRVEEHEAVLIALQDHDAAAARAAMRQHFSRLLATMLDANEERALNQARLESAKSRERYLISTKIS
jgi:GntR family hexuronate regulon transcriptional repressor